MIQIEYDYKTGGGWGDAINWWDSTEFAKKELSTDTIFECYGWKDKIPKVGQTLLSEFVKTWMLFEFVEVNRCTNPQDMFFAKVKPINQYKK